MTTSQMVNIIYPLTKEDWQCGMKKKEKLRKRAELILLINEYMQGNKVELPQQVLILMNGCE